MKAITQTFEMLHASFLKGIKNPNAVTAKKWMASKDLSIEKTFAGFNSGQVHHGKEETFKQALLEAGVLKRAIAVHHQGIPYSVFGKMSIMFPLKNDSNEIVNFYAIGIKKNKGVFLNQAGIYPCPPDMHTKILFITESVLDTATILESGILKEGENVMTIPNGTMMEQHKQAIKRLKALEKVIYFTAETKK